MSTASRSGGAPAILSLRLMLGVLFLSVWGSNLSKGLYVPNEWIWLLVFPTLVAFLLAIVSAGRIVGLDSILLDRAPLDRLPRWARG